MNDNVFKEGSVPVAVVARVYGKDASWVRAGIISGWLPIGKATRNGKLIGSVEFRQSVCMRKLVICGREKRNEHYDKTGSIGEEQILDRTA